MTFKYLLNSYEQGSSTVILMNINYIFVLLSFNIVLRS